jgi:hypothetical protein
MARNRIVMEQRDIQLATEGIAPAEIAKELAVYARRSLRDVIAAGEASPIYERYVNGRQGADESDVVPPGPILYEFAYWDPIIDFALAELRRRSPVLSGRYRDSHVVMIGSQVIGRGVVISAGEEVMIVDTQPYARKIEVGHMLMSVPDGVYKDVSRRVANQFRGMITVGFKMVTLPDGYILKGVFRRGYKEFARKGLQKDTRAGERMTYPSFTMKMRAA